MDEEDINKLSEELKAFTEGLKKFNKDSSRGGRTTPTTTTDDQKVASNFDKSTQKIVNALGILSANLVRTSGTENQKNQHLQEFNLAVKKSTQVQQESADRAAATIAAKKQVDADNIRKQKEIADASAAAAEATRRSTLLFNGRVEDAIEGLKNFGASVKEFPKEATNRLKDFNKSLNDDSKSLNERISIYRGHDNVGKQTFESLSRVGSNSEMFATQLDVATNGSKLAYTATQVLSAAFEGAKKAVVGYTSAIYKGERGAKAAAKAYTDLATPMLDLAGTIGNVVTALSWLAPGGIIGKGLVFIGGSLLKVFGEAGKAALKYNELASEQADTLYTTFMDLNKSGVVLNGGLTDTFNSMQELGMSVAEASQFTSFLSGSAKDLKFLGATAGQGAKEFSKVAGSLYKSDLGRELELMGISQEEQREAALKYMSIQARTGAIQTKNTQELVKASAEFNKEMDLAAQLAGNTRKEQIEAREEAMADERFNAAMREAKETGDTARVAELEKASAMAAQFKAAGDETARAGVLQIAASRGALTTDAAMKLEMQYGVSKALFDKSLTAKDIPDIMKGAADYSKMQDRSLSGANQLVGRLDIQTSGQGAANLQDRQAAITEAMREAGFKGTQAQFMETEQAKRFKPETVDAGLASQTGLRRAQKDVALMEDEFIRKFYDTSKINENAAKQFNEAVKKFGGWVGHGKVVGGNIQHSANLTQETNSTVARPTPAKLSDSPTIPQTINQNAMQNLSNIKAEMMKRGEKDENYMTSVLANVMKETGGINKPEDLSGYAKTDNSRIKKIFGSRVNNMPDAELNRVKSNPQLMAETIYGGEWGKKNLGNMEPGDGWKYRGRGHIQLTGKSNYAEASRAIYKDDRLVENPDLITQDARVATEVTAWFMERGKKSLAKKMDIPLNNMSRGEADLLATSIVAGGDVRNKSDYIRTELLNKVSRYSNSKEIRNVKPTSLEYGNADIYKQETALPVNENIRQKVLAAEPVSAAKSDPVNFKAKTGGIFKGPSTGYNVTLHDEEIVVPANEGVSKQALNTSIFSRDDSGVKDMISLLERMNEKYDDIIDLLSVSADNSDKLVIAAS